MEAAIVLDASAVLALMLAEPGAQMVAATLPGALLSTVSLADIVAKLCERGLPADLAHQSVLRLEVRMEAFSEEQASLSGALRPVTKDAGLSLGDRACLALAKTRSATVLTADTVWVKVAGAVGVQVRPIR